MFYALEIGERFVLAEGEWPALHPAARLEAWISGARLPSRVVLAPSANGARFRVLVPIDKASAPRELDDFRLRLADGGGELRPHDGLQLLPGRCRGNLESIAGSRVTGWASVNCEAVPFLSVNGHSLGPLSLDHPRPDVAAAAFSDCLETGFIFDLLSAPKDALEAIRSAQNGFEIILSGGGLELSRLVVTAVGAPKGYIENVDGVVAGWAGRTFPAPPDLEIELRIDGAPFARTWPQEYRADVLRKDFQGKGFTFHLPWSVTGASRAEVALAALPEGVVFARCEAELRPRPESSIAFALARMQEQLRHPVVVVIDDDAADLIPVLRSLRACGETQVWIIAAHDRAGIAAQMASNAGVEANVTASALACGEEERRDILAFSPYARPAPGQWHRSLRVCAYRDDCTLSVEPLSESCALIWEGLSPPPGWPETVVEEMRDRTLAQANLRARPAFVLNAPVCVYLRRDLLDTLAASLPEQAIARLDMVAIGAQASRLGLRHVVHDGAYVRDARGFQDPRAPLDAACAIDDELAARRAALGTAFAANAARFALSKPPYAASGKPRVLFVLATDQGGTALTNADLMRGLRAEYDTWLLRCDSRTMQLFRVSEKGLEAVATRRLTYQLDPVSHRSPEYDETAANWLADYAVEIVHVRHIAWHSLGLAQVCQVLSIPLIFSLHDFYVVCPSLKLLDESARHCAGRCTASEGICAVELWDKGQLPPLKRRWVHRWRALMAEFLERCTALVTTDESARCLILDAHPQLENHTFHVIPHGRNLKMRAPRAQINQQGPARILLPGALSKAKGAGIVAGLAAMDRGEQLEFHVLGDIVPELYVQGVVQHGPYARDEFADRALEIDARFGAVFSIWPETYCHTLTELWSIGLPVAGFDYGAVAARIRDTGAGWVLPHADITALHRALVKIALDNKMLEIARGHVGAWQSSQGTVNNVATMARHYDRLYNQEMLKNRQFK